MRSFDSLRRDFDLIADREPFRPLLEIAESGLVLGYGTVLARMAATRRGERMLAVDLDEERVLALLSAVCGCQIPPKVMHQVRRASEHLRRGEKVLAQIELAFARIPRLEAREDAFRLFLADDLLANGFTPRRLARELGFDVRLLKYSPDEKRVPAGHGLESGEWTKGDGSQQPQNNSESSKVGSEIKSNVTIRPVAAAAAPLAFAPGAGTLAVGLFAPEVATPFLLGLGILGDGIGAGLVFGAIFVPFNKQNMTTGTLPGDPDLHYTYNPGDQPFLEIHHGDEVLAIAKRVGDIFYESETGTPIARMVGDHLVFDADSIASVGEFGRTEARAKSVSESETEEPQLCPDPGPDVPHGASALSIAYQAYISFLNNPTRALPPGMAVSLPDPDSPRRVVYDDCRESDGAMIEAKGPSFARLLKSDYLKGVLAARWIKQGARQVRAATWRSNEWFFAEKEAADFAREVFAKAGLGKIQVHYEPLEN